MYIIFVIWKIVLIFNAHPIFEFQYIDISCNIETPFNIISTSFISSYGGVKAIMPSWLLSIFAC